MPRAARIDIPDLLQHIMVRGIEKRDIFYDDTDRHAFLQRLEVLLQETGTACFAWALMTNHFHLLLRPSNEKLATFMRRLLTGYAVVFNLRHHRSGHLFQNRYKSVVCEEDAYLLELVRYIHLNPVRVGVVSDVGELDGYPWTGHSVLLGNQILGGQNIDEVLSYFGKKVKVARSHYRKFIRDGVKQGHRSEFAGGGLHRVIKSGVDEHPIVYDERVLGSGEFVLDLTGEHAPSPQEKAPISEIIRKVSEALGINGEEIRAPGRSAVVACARSVISYIGYRKMGHSGEMLAKELGITRSGVCRRAAAGEKIVHEDRRFRQLFPE
jgi:putative transposase